MNQIAKQRRSRGGHISKSVPTHRVDLNRKRRVHISPKIAHRLRSIRTKRLCPTNRDSATTHAMAFLTNPLPVASPSTTRRPVVCALRRDSRALSRRDALSAAAAAVAAAAGAAAFPTPARAAGGVGIERAVSKFFFPKEGFNVPDAPLPGALNRSVLETAAGKAAVESLRKYQEAVDELYTEFKNDPQAKLNPRVGAIFQISELRGALNTFGEAFDEDAQRETDKVVRNIIQDVGELKTAAALREGATRTQRKIERTTDWFEKLVSDFKRLMAYYA